MRKRAAFFIRPALALFLASLTFAGVQKGGTSTAGSGPATAAQPPVLVIPGIMGSFSSCLFVDPASGKACPAQQEFTLGGGLDSIDLTPQWVLDPISIPPIKTPTYDSLVEALQNAGLQVFPAPYDWRQENQVTAATTLAGIIQSAKQQTGSDTVDIVAHSMGGLVVRSYIEQLNKSDVRKFIMLGTPNRGSAEAYYEWEGGDFSVSGFETEIIFIYPLVEDMKIGYGCQNMPDYQFIEQKIPAARQLLPIDTYVFRKNSLTGKYKPVPVTSMHWQNNLIPALNYNILISNLALSNIMIFAGTDSNLDDTIENIRVAPKVFGAQEWADGKPVSAIYGSGDGTVLLASVRLGDITVTQNTSDHDGLPDACKDDVVQFITGQSSATGIQKPGGSTEKPSKPSLESFLFIGTSSHIHMGITSGENLRLGNFPAVQGKVAEFQNYYYRGNSKETAALGLYNAVPGEYVLDVSTDEPSEDYDIYISYFDRNGKRKNELQGRVSSGNAATYVIKIDNELLLLPSKGYEPQ